MSLPSEDFVVQWKCVTWRERRVDQERCIALVSHPTPNESDAAGTRFALEMGAPQSRLSR